MFDDLWSLRQFQCPTKLSGVFKKSISIDTSCPSIVGIFIIQNEFIRSYFKIHKFQRSYSKNHVIVQLCVPPVLLDSSSRLSQNQNISPKIQQMFAIIETGTYTIDSFTPPNTEWILRTPNGSPERLFYFFVSREFKDISKDCFTTSRCKFK